METYEEHYHAMCNAIRKRMPNADMALIDRAVDYAAGKHAAQKRKDGSPYIIHPLAVAQIVTEMGLDQDAILGALLHDCIEDTDASHEEIERLFGTTVAELVEGVTKLTRANFSSTEQAQMENLRKMFMAMSKDIRVVLIKIADRLHNMRTIQDKITQRLTAVGIHNTTYGRIKHVYSIYRKTQAQGKTMDELYDIYAFRVIVDTIPDCYNVLGHIHDLFNLIPGRFKDYISTPKPNMYQSLHTTVIGSQGIPFEVQIRTWEMHETAEYGIAAHWKYKIGSAAETIVKDGDEEKFAWVRRLLESQQESDATDFFHNLKIDMFADEVFVFSPKGDVINLPAGATPIDFAYSIHSAVGNSMIGASVNGRIVNFDYVLQNGDIVEVRTSKSATGPSRDWLNIAKSGSARTKIKQWFKKERREENIERGRAMFESELKNRGLRMEDICDEEVLPQLLKKVSYASLDEMYAAIGYGGMAATRAVNRMKDELARLHHASGKKTVLEKVTEAAERREQQASRKVKPVHGVLVEGLDNCLIKFSRCCTPIPGDDIVGYITRGQGVSIHRTDCANYARREFKPEDIGRWINVSWADEIKESYATAITVVSRERNGLIMDIAAIFNTLNTKVRTINARDTGDKSIVNITLETSGIDELRTVVNRISALPGVVEVNRNGGKK